MTNLAYASIKSIATALDVDRPSAKALLRNYRFWARQSVDATLDVINDMLDGHGVEAIRSTVNDGGYFQDIAALYVNMGDVYITTVLYDTKRRQWYLTDMGTWAEKQGNKII